jgi:hypothetical protein
MENILHNLFKILFGGIFISAGIGLPTIMSTGHSLECQPDLQVQGMATKASPPTVTCEILQMGGGTLFTKGTQVIDRQSQCTKVLDRDWTFATIPTSNWLVLSSRRGVSNIHEVDRQSKSILKRKHCANCSCNDRAITTLIGWIGNNLHDRRNS